MHTFHDTLPQVARWGFDASASRIHAFNAEGHVVMAIPAPPLFGLRLAEAFGQSQRSHPMDLGSGR
jgi:hypothetical protein